MSKHTPGPWHVTNHTEVFVRDYAGYICIADCFARQLPPHERAANAILIAAAPDLLEALRTIVNDYEFVKNNVGFGDRSAAYAETARKAIAKAEGADHDA